VSQPKLPADIEAELAGFGFVSHCYQPVSLFKPGKRALPNVPNKDDPWEVFLRYRARPHIGIVSIGYGATLREAINDAISKRPGVTAAVARLGAAMEDLTGTFQCL
jgi:hypothetical protein